MSGPAELTHVVRLDRVPQRGTVVPIEASAGQREALSVRFGLLALSSLRADVTVRPSAGEIWVVEGRLVANVTQACVVSLDPVEQRIEEAFTLRFVGGEQAAAAGAELVLEGDSDAPEPLEGDEIDVGELVAEQLSLALDPFPRRPGAVLPVDTGGAADAARVNPFAALAGLKARLDTKQ